MTPINLTVLIIRLNTLFHRRALVLHHAGVSLPDHLYSPTALLPSSLGYE